MPYSQDIIAPLDTQRKTRSRADRMKVAVLWALILGVELYALLWDVPIFSPPPLPRSHQAARSLGEIQLTENVVRIQGAQDVLWDQAISPGEVYSGMRIMTLDQSYAEILLRGHGKLTLQENTLIVLEDSQSVDVQDSGRLKLLRGNLRWKAARSEKPVTVEFPQGARLTLQPGSEVRTSGSRIEVLSGEARNPVSGETFQSGQSIEVTGESFQRTELVPEAAHSPEPSPLPEVTPEPTRAPRLKAPQLKSPRIRIRDKPVQPSGFRPAAGEIFAWAVSILFPSAMAGDERTYQPLEIDLQWEPVMRASGYRLQISRDRGFRSLILEQDLSSPNYTWEYEPGMENSKGRVFYRVGSVNESGRVVNFSKTEMIVIPEHRPAPSPKAPEPVTMAVAPASPPVKPVESTHRHQLTLGTSYAKTAQSSATRGLQNVREDSPHFHELLTHRFRLHPRWISHLEIEHRRWRSDSGTHATQPDLTAIDGGWAFLRNPSPRSLTLRWGGWIDRSSRFEKATRSTVKLESTWSLGPAAELHFPEQRLLIQLALPVTGLLQSTQWGGRLSVKRDFTLGRLLLIPEARMKLLRWDQPEDTEVREWAFAGSLGCTF